MKQQPRGRRLQRAIALLLCFFCVSRGSGYGETAPVERGIAPSSLARKVLADFQQSQAPLRNDVVIVLPSTTSRIAIVQATQRSRKGVRTFVVNDKGPALDGNGVARKQIQLRISHRPQVFGAFKGSDIAQQPTGLTELRIALAPFLANQTLGNKTFKWLLFGHDDTVWMVENTLKLLRGLDAGQPYLITDNLWFEDEAEGSRRHPHPDAPFCLPCGSKGFSDLGMRSEKGVWKCILNEKEAPLGCPCNRSSLAENVLGRQLLDPATLDFKNSNHKAAFRIHLGGGVLMSRGLFSLKSFDEVQSWMNARTNESADAIFTSVIWDLLRVAPTKPGTDYCRPGVTLFDPGWQGARRRGQQDPGKDGGNDPLGIIHQLEGALRDDGSCGKGCLQRLDGMVTAHVRQRFASKDLPADLVGMSDEAPRFNATVSLIAMLTERADNFQRQRWVQEQAFMAAGNR